jgi:osmoprotectant transport system ATP-binding protein
MSDVTLERVSKSFAGRLVVRETSLRVGPGERVALIGPSGSGKSTLLKMVLGLVTPDTGRVTVGGVEVNEASARGVRRLVGYVVQDGGLFPHLTAEENVTLVARLEGKDVRARVRELTKVVRLDPSLLSSFPEELSGGERQRVGLLRALVLDPDVLLLDEPLAALDPMVRAELQRDLRDIFARLGRTVVLVTHDVAEAAFLAGRIVLLAQGRVVQEGTIDDLRERPVSPFVTAFLTAQQGLSR